MVPKRPLSSTNTVVLFSPDPGDQLNKIVKLVARGLIFSALTYVVDQLNPLERAGSVLSNLDGLRHIQSTFGTESTLVPNSTDKTIN